MNGLIGLGGVLLLLFAAGGLIGLADRKHFRPEWLLVAALLVAVNDALLTGGYGALPQLIEGEWNWQGKILALLATLAIAALPAFGWRRVGLTLRQEPGSLRAAVPVAARYGAFIHVIALDLGGRAGAPATPGRLTGLTRRPGGAGRRDARQRRPALRRKSHAPQTNAAARITRHQPTAHHPASPIGVPISRLLSASTMGVTG